MFLRDTNREGALIWDFAIFWPQQLNHLVLHRLPTSDAHVVDRIAQVGVSLLGR